MSRAESFEKVIQTAYLTAYPRTFSDIPLSSDIFTELEKIKKKNGSEIPDELKAAKLAPELEARYKLVNKLLEKRKINNILEIAAGLSQRGLLMSRNSAIEYVEMDLPSMILEKREIIRILISKSKIKKASNLHLEQGNALSMVDLSRAASNFKSGPIAIVNEGLLRYLNFNQKAKVARNIHKLLEKYGGVWITPDITLRKLLLTQNKVTMPGKNKRVAEMTKKKIDKNQFESEKHARDFFEKLDFSVEQHSALEVIKLLSSPKKLRIQKDKVKEMIAPVIVFVMKLK